ncbi:MAG: N-6 DNA methylase [Spongiibacteraceae bacterium]
MHTPLDKTLRNQLERAVIKARDIAELATQEELSRLSVGEKAAADYLNAEQKALRNRLRVHGRALGDRRKPSGEQTLDHLIGEVAYEHWHRMLFARFLAENNLLMYEDGVTALSIQDCFDLAEEETGDSANGWRYAAQYAAKMLPQIFRVDSPVFELQFAPNHQKQLEQLLSDLPQEVFTASDSLGWVYQFWQTKKKDAVNASEVKIGADELPAVTQLFTEPYMVSFLLDNSLGAWWAAKKLSANDFATAKSEKELREKAAIYGVPLDYLRFVQEEDEQGNKTWAPAAGTHEAWPKKLKDFKTLDPCCGSGHFLVAAFNMLVPLRMVDEGLSAQGAVDSVLRDNIHGLELDQRCVELAAFALALSAWKYPNAGGYRPLPRLNVACSGLPIMVRKDDWLALAGDDTNLSIALEHLYDQFRDAPVLGSLIDPEASLAKGTLFEFQWGNVGEMLRKALSGKESLEKDELSVIATGTAEAANMLVNRYHWVVTNVPYLGRGQQNDILAKHSERYYPEGKSDLANVFLERCLHLCLDKGKVGIVMPQNWLFLVSYKNFREKLLTGDVWNLLARLGAGAFETISGEVVKAILLVLERNHSTMHDLASDATLLTAKTFRGVEVSNCKSVQEKANGLVETNILVSSQKDQLSNPNCIISFELLADVDSLGVTHTALFGSGAGDRNRFTRFMSELPINSYDTWQLLQSSPSEISSFDGRKEIILWENESGQMKELADSVKHLNHKAQQWRSGKPNWGKRGVIVSLMSNLPATIYTGEIYEQQCAAVVPSVQSKIKLAALWAFCSSNDFKDTVRILDQKLSITPGTLLNVPFDYERWQKVADEKYPNGLPRPYSDESTQWIFHGHPCGSVVWDENSKWTAEGETRIDDTVLQIAVARLLGYRWPAELDADMELADEQRSWVERCDSLLAFADDDGIACLPAVRGEQAAHDRLEALLQAAYGKEWNTQTRNKLLEAVGCKNQSLEFWLREKFFEQHCKLFQHRPFIWHIWDGLKDGFSALVNYHQLDKKNLERLIYTYLDDWIRHQKLAAKDGVDGADIRVNAAERLKERLEQILEGEAPYDIFVRWKSLAEQPIGWNPDLNDGVRMNSRPFMSVDDVGKKGAGILKAKPNIKWDKDRGKDVESAPWFTTFGGDRINDHHLSLAEKLAAKK